MESGQSPPEALISTHHADPAVSPLRQLRAMSALTGRNPAEIAREYARLSSGPGKLNFQDYVQLRLFDDAFIGGADKSAFSGRMMNTKLFNEINHDRDWFQLATNKVAMGAYLRAHGFPAIEPQAVYVEGVGWPSSVLLSTPEALVDFFRSRAVFPVFCKPTDGKQSLGSVVLTGLGDDDGVRVKDGREMSLHGFARFISQTYPRGYVIQSCVPPAPELTALTQGALATVRVVTAFHDGMARVMRACLKIPAAGNVADNYWRPGNLLGRLDAWTGGVVSVTEGVGLELAQLDMETACGGQLRNLAVPDWERLRDLAKAAQVLMQELPLIGWDIAPTPDGPVIVEINPAPDAMLNQIADRSGLLEPALLAMAARGRAARKTMLAQSRTEMQKFSAYRI